MRELKLRNGSRIAIIGGDPAGTFFAHFALKLARQKGLEVIVTIFDGKNFVRQGPPGCNMCAGVISETLLARLEEERLQAQRAVIEAEKANDLLSAQKDLEINRARAEAAAEAARAELAKEFILAQLYAEHPDYVYLQVILANASALNQTDKIIFTPEGTTPTIVLPGPGIVPTVESSPSE